MAMQIDHPFHVVPGDDAARHVTQLYANNNAGIEPFGFKYADGSIWYVTAPGAEGGCWHNGIDYSLDLGTPLYAPADGTIAFAGWGAPGTVPIDTRGFG